MEDKYVVTLMKKKQIFKNDTYICHCNNEDDKMVLIGNYVDNTFYGSDGEIYLPIDDIDFLETDDYDYGFANIISLKELSQQFGYRTIPKGAKLQRLLEEYYEMLSDTVYMLIDDFEGVMQYPINISNIYDAFYDETHGYDMGERVKVSDGKNVEISINDLILSIAYGYYQVDQLKLLKSQFSSQVDNLNGLLDTIDLSIEAQENGQEVQVIYSEEQPLTNKEYEKSIIEKDNKTVKNELLNIKEIYKNCQKTLVGQDDALLKIITEIASMEFTGLKDDGILITGDSGVGKTKSMQLISKYINKPFLIIDSTQLTIPGYVGRNIEDFLAELLSNCGNDVKKAENAIIYFDEIDKKGSSRKSDVSGQGVLNVLLKFLDGTEYFVNGYKISTKNMIVIAGGAYTDVYNNIYDKSPVGFLNKNSQINKEVSVNDFIDKAQMTKEFMARFPTIVHFDDMDYEKIKTILENSDESPLKLEQEKFKKLGVDLEFTDLYKDKIINNALNKKTGVRGLRGVVKDTTRIPFGEIAMSDDSYEKLILSDEVVEDPKKYVLIKTKK